MESSWKATAPAAILQMRLSTETENAKLSYMQAAHENDLDQTCRTSLASNTTLVNDYDNDFDEVYDRYSSASHMGVLDPSYHIFTSEQGYGSLVYIIRHRTLVVTGDPLCPVAHFQSLLEELRRFRKAKRLGIAFMGMSECFAKFSRQQGWMALQFGRERVLNPLKNDLFRKKGAGRRMLSQNRCLLDPKRGGMSLHLYAPGLNAVEPVLEVQLQRLYDDWREERNSQRHGSLQTFVTVYDLFSRRAITLFIYTRDRDGQINGFAALRKLGAHSGFHIDPCIALSSTPRGITDLLIISAMELLRDAGISYLSLGYEPSIELESSEGKDGLTARLACKSYRRVMDSAQLGGKKTYNDKFRPDDTLSSTLYIVFPGGPSLVQQAIGVLYAANIDLKRLLFAKSWKERKTSNNIEKPGEHGKAGEHLDNLKAKTIK